MPYRLPLIPAILLSAAVVAPALVGGDAIPAAAAVPCAQRVTYTAKMVPSCGVLWGVTANAFEATQGPGAHRQFEALSRRKVGIYHAYYRGDDKFPSAKHIALLHEPGKRRMLLANWKVAHGMTWRAVANGRADARIDAWSRYVKRYFPERFFLAIHHEPENDVRAAPAAGMTPSDYRAMFRHTVQRLRRNGVSNAITVWNPMGYYGWIAKPWFETLYPGDDVTDWVAWDPYVQSKVGVDQTLTTLVNKPANVRLPNGAKFPGTYRYMMSRHGNKPFMLAEFGYQHVRDKAGRPVPVPATGVGSRARFYTNIPKELYRYPNLKAMVYFDTVGNGSVKDPPTHVDQTAASLVAWRALSRDPRLLNPLPTLGGATPARRPSQTRARAAAVSALRLRTSAGQVKALVVSFRRGTPAPIRVSAQRRTRAGWRTVAVTTAAGTHRRAALRVPVGRYRAVAQVAGRTVVSRARRHAGSRPLLRAVIDAGWTGIDVNPPLVGARAWRVRVDRWTGRRFVTATRVRTKGTAELARALTRSARVRVVVPGQHGFRRAAVVVHR